LIYHLSFFYSIVHPTLLLNYGNLSFLIILIPKFFDEFAFL
jgi:hypothetical protein